MLCRYIGRVRSSRCDVHVLQVQQKMAVGSWAAFHLLELFPFSGVKEP